MSHGRATVVVASLAFLAVAWIARLLYVVSDDVRVRVDPSAVPRAWQLPPVTAPPRGKSLPPSISSMDGSVMLLVPEGEFSLGVPDTDLVDGPSIRVEVKAFYIDRLEVTCAQFARFVTLTGYVARGPWQHYVNPNRMDLPVAGVTAADATEYARWSGKRLPTEIEWEKAARGPHGHIWPWGDILPARKDLASYAVTGDTANGGPKPVGSAPLGESPYGALDMAGSVWEWTESRYEPYSGSRARSALFGTGMRVLRGGSWNFNVQDAKSTPRMPMPPRLWAPDVGFRCVVSALP